MTKINKDPYPITDVYHVTDTSVDGAEVVVTDLCENLSNQIQINSESVFEDLKKKNTKKFNSISVSNSIDGEYPVWVGVDENNKVRKIFANTNVPQFGYYSKKTKKLVSWEWDKDNLNNQFFSKSNQNVKRQKLFDMKINSGAIVITDSGMHFKYEHHSAVLEVLNEKYFKINNIYQNNYPIGLFVFSYGDPEAVKSTSSESLKKDQQKVIELKEFKPIKYTEFLSNLLDEDCYPTKYIFEKYLLEIRPFKDIDRVKIRIIDEKLSTNYLLKRLPKALEILKRQNQILFGKNFKEVHEIRKTQFEDFIHGIVKNVELQELNLSKYVKKINKLKVKNNKLTINVPGLASIQDAFYDGYKLKTEPSLLEIVTIPVKNGKYPCYIHSYSDKEIDEDGNKFNNVYVVVEGLEGCYLNRNSKGQIFFDKTFRESLFLRENINNKSKKILIDNIDLRNSESLKELEKISFVEELELHGLKNITNWAELSKLKNLKKLKLVACNVNYIVSDNFFKSLYSLNNLEELIINDRCFITTPSVTEEKKFPKNLYFKKIKSYEIEFRKDWINTNHKNYPDYKGYGNEKAQFIYVRLPNIYNFPNFEKFKSLEKLRLYNYFDLDEKEGSLFINYELSGVKLYFKTINQLCKISKIKDIWIDGYHFNKTDELVDTSFLEAALLLTKDTDVKVNGINNSTLTKIKKNIELT